MNNPEPPESPVRPVGTRDIRLIHTPDLADFDEVDIDNQGAGAQQYEANEFSTVGLSVA